jgi:hypothetical protein
MNMQRADALSAHSNPISGCNAPASAVLLAARPLPSKGTG